MGGWIRQRTLAAIGAVTVALSGCAYAAGSAVYPVHFKTGIALLVAGLVVALIPTLFLVAFRIRHARMEERLKATESLVELVHQLIGLDKSHDLRATELRVTLLKVKTDKTGVGTLQQVARYTCAGPEKVGGSWMFSHQGIAGRCCNTTATQMVNQVGDDFIEWMLDYGFSREEARRFTPRQAYLCCPVVNEVREVIGVLCLDAATKNAFTPHHALTAEATIPFFGRLLREAEVHNA
jgi:GAF domain-containing protein